MNSNHVYDWLIPSIINNNWKDEYDQAANEAFDKLLKSQSVPSDITIDVGDRVRYSDNIWECKTAIATANNLPIHNDPIPEEEETLYDNTDWLKLLEDI